MATAEAPHATLEPIARPGSNCWCIANAERFAALIDADEYFHRLVEVLSRARRSIFILGWDIDSRLDLHCADGGEPVRLAELLDRLAHAQRKLRIHVLCWDYNALLALDRERSTLEQLGRRTHRHVRFRFDDKHPLGACHHQKIVVVDDTVAFVGGLDLTLRRWDTCAHRHEEPGRVDASGAPYPPYHDVQAIVGGDVAQALGRLARQRWRSASRRHVPPLQPRPVDELWPPDLRPELTDVPVAISRTAPAFARRPAVHEVREHLLGAIAAARRWIYIENQYFTSAPIAAALAARLSEPDGPEVVLVLPRLCSGWMEQHTIGALRVAALKILKDGDAHGRLRTLHPMASREHDTHVFVHSKVMCIDDRWLRIGSSNFNNRSMGMDTECDLVVEGLQPEHRRGIARMRDRMLAEHLGAAPERVAEETERTGSLVAAVDGLPDGDRAPVGPGDVECDATAPGLYYEFGVDPEGPMQVSRLIDRFLPEVVDPGWRKHRREVQAVLLGVLVLAGLTLAWNLTPLGNQVRLDDLLVWTAARGHRPTTALLVVGGSLIAALLVVPPAAIMVVTVIALGAWPGAAWALLGGLLGHLLVYGLGRLFGGAIASSLADSAIARMARRVRNSNVSTVVMLRLLPIAPGTILDIVCGVARVRAGAFIAGSLLGTLPVLLLAALFGAALRALAFGPSLGALAILVLVVVATLLGARGIRRRVKAHELANAAPASAAARA